MRLPLVYPASVVVKCKNTIETEEFFCFSNIKKEEDIF